VLARDLPPGGRRFTRNRDGALMDVLLIMALLVILVGVLGYTGVIGFLRAGAWLIVVFGVLILLLSFVL
jgi:hypothetical protein